MIDTFDSNEGGMASRRDFLRCAALISAGFALERESLGALLAKTDDADRPPAVVIGAGLGGLSAAAHLARAGFPVTLVERHDRPGGYATTYERANGKFVFDVSLHATMNAQRALRSVLEGAGVLDKVETVELPDLCRIVTPDYDMIWPQRDPDAIARLLSEHFPAEAEGINGLFAEILGILDEAMQPFDPSDMAQRMRFPMTHPKMWAIRDKTLADLMDGFISDPKLRSIFSAFWGYYGLPPSKLSGFYYAIATASYMREGGYYFVRRSQDLSDALKRSIEEAGGTVLLETEATGIALENGAVSAVILSDGRELPAGAVISNASVPTTMAMLPPDGLPEGAAAYLGKLEGYRPSLSTFIVWLGLNKEIRGQVDGYELFVANGYDVEAAYQAALGSDPHAEGYSLTVYDNAYKGYSQPGSSIVTIMTLCGYEPWKRFEADYFAGRKADYNREKKRIADELIAQVESHFIPGLRGMIEVCEIGTPLTNVFYTANPEGAIYGYEQAMNNAYMNRLGVDTPIGGLYCASAWTNPGGGFQPCLESGRTAFLQLLVDLEAKA